MKDKDRLLKRIADLILAFVAFLGLILSIVSISPSIKIDITNILIITGILLFLSFVILITHHTSKLEKAINQLEKDFQIEGRLINIENKLKIR